MPKPTDKPQKIFYDPISVAKRTKQVANLVSKHDKSAMLYHIIKNTPTKQSVIITKNKRTADELSRFLKTKEIKAQAVHGNHRAEQCQITAKEFNEGKINILITTDMILTSLDLSNIQQMVSYDLPNEPKLYLTRLGYLKEIGESIAFVTPDEQSLLSAVEFTMKQSIAQEEVKDFVHSPVSSENNLREFMKEKDKKKKPRHRKIKRKKESKEKEA
ncbi:ATP-dependent helicase [bacterium]|nr:ATP-dependent helicase [bacterium]MBU1884884.1 ATP-dependent helicase [bacterium]